MKPVPQAERSRSPSRNPCSGFNTHMVLVSEDQIQKRPFGLLCLEEGGAQYCQGSSTETILGVPHSGPSTASLGVSTAMGRSQRERAAEAGVHA